MSLLLLVLVILLLVGGLGPLELHQYTGGPVPYSIGTVLLIVVLVLLLAGRL